MHDDLQVMRIFQLEKCLADGQIPCRWSADMAYGYGQAMFNYYSAFPYYLGALLRVLLPLQIVDTVRLLFALSLISAAFGMYLLGKEFWGRKGGLVASVLYTYAPYHALDVYVRGAMAESFALAIYPFLWYFFYKLIKEPKYKYIFATAIFLALLLITHNISTMVFAPLTLVWVGFWLLYSRKWRSIPGVAAAGLLGIGLASFFILPAVFEQNLIQTHYLTNEYSNFRGHFVTVRQLFLERDWGDGPSIFGEEDNLSFQIGWPHWWILPLLGIVSFFTFLKRRKSTILATSFLLLSLFFAFLAHSRSAFLWEKITLLAFVQFPWRFLGLTIFFAALAGGALIYLTPKLKRLLTVAIIISSVLLNYKYFIPINYSRLVTDDQKLSGLAFELQQKAAIVDYLPKTALVAPVAKAFPEPKTISGSASIKNYNKGSDRFSFDIEAYTSVEVEVPVMYFPNWKLILDDQLVEPGIHGEHGLIKVSLPEGIHHVRGVFRNTPTRTYANALTLIALCALLVGGALAKKNENK